MNHDGTDRRVALVLMAHPDDAEIMCGGTLTRLVREHGYEAYIVTTSAGDCGSASLPSNTIAAIRQEEAQRAAAIIGATYHCLEQRDVDVVFDHAANRKTIDLFRHLSPTLVITHPRHDYMLDHEQTHLLARSAAFAFPIPNASALPLPENAAVPHLYYADPMEGRDPYTGQLVEPTTRIDVSTAMATKIDMLAAHASQRDWLREHHGMDEYIDAMQRHAAMRGSESGVSFAEAFIQHRGHAFPQDDLLTNLLSPTPT